MKYRKFDSRTWSDEQIHALEPLDKLVAVYVLTGQCNRIGIFKFSVALAAEDLGLPAEDVRERLERVCDRLSWKYDSLRRVLFLPTWWKYNNPGSGKTLKGLLSDVHDLPETPLLQEFAANKKYLPDRLSDILCHSTTARCAQEQEQEQEQYIATNVACAEACSAPPSSPSLPSSHTFPVKRSKAGNATTWALPQAELDRLIGVYGEHLDVPAELTRAGQWLHANPPKRKTAGGMLSFLTRWLNRASNAPATGAHTIRRVPRGPELDPVKANATYHPGG